MISTTTFIMQCAIPDGAVRGCQITKGVFTEGLFTGTPKVFLVRSECFSPDLSLRLHLYLEHSVVNSVA